MLILGNLNQYLLKGSITGLLIFSSIYIALFFTRLKSLIAYPDVEYLFNFRMIFVSAIIEIIEGTLIGFVRFIKLLRDIMLCLMLLDRHAMMLSGGIVTCLMNLEMRMIVISYVLINNIEELGLRMQLHSHYGYYPMWQRRSIGYLSKYLHLKMFIITYNIIWIYTYIMLSLRRKTFNSKLAK